MINQGRKQIPQTQSSEYIRNLQQQIYLLELETRYMYFMFDKRKSGKRGGASGKSHYHASNHSLGIMSEKGSLQNLEANDDDQDVRKLY